MRSPSESPKAKPEKQKMKKTRKYFTIQPGITRHLSETWSLDLHYRFRWQERSSDTQDSDSNGVFLAINYQPLSEFGKR